MGDKTNMLRILSWNSNTGFEKMHTQDLPSLGQDASPSVVSCASAVTKRKRSFEPAILPRTVSQAVKTPSSAEVKTPLPAQLSNGSPNACTAPSVAESPALRSIPASTNPANDGKMEVDSESLSAEKVKSREEAQLATMRQTISSQLSLEILLKHRELRLIDQELAKCQVALEQLRRCTEIPYPALQQPSEQTSLGKGSAVRKSSERQLARSPAPWGVTDGPYSRHYAKWLLSDPHFDGGEPEPATPVSSASLHGRSTRGLYTDFAQMVGKTSRSQRALNAGLPPGYSEPKPKPTGPMILKRKSDGRMVKLVCPDCGRFDFGSAQGFINHCRIGHQRNFASHDAAAEGCGEPVELDENGTIKGSSAETPIPVMPVMPVAATPPSTPVAASTSSATAHPLVRSAHLIPKDAPAKLLVKGGYVPKVERKGCTVSKSVSPKSQCSETPNLSAFLQDRGVSLNLRDAVSDAKTKTELSEDTSDEDMDMDMDSPLPTPVGNSRHPPVAGSKQPVKSTDYASTSRKSSFVQARNRQSINGSLATVNTANEDIHFNHFMPLIPSPTNESTQAPSLIDDDEELEPQSPPSSDELDDTDVQFHVRDDEHPEEGSELRGAEMPTPTTTCTQPTAPNQPPMAAPSPFAQPLNSKDARVNFIAEHPRSEDQNDQKRRRIGP